MTWLFAASELESFRLTGAVNNYGVATNSSYFDPVFSKASFVCNSVANDAYADFPNQTELWVHAYVTVTSYIQNQVLLSLIDSATGTERIQLQQSGNYQSGTLALGYWNGSGFTYLTALPIANNGLHTLDLHIKLDAVVGVVSFYSDGVLVGSFTGNTSGIATALKSLRALGGGSCPYLSQIIVGDGAQSTVGLRLQTLQPAAGGNTNNWTGGTTVSNITDNSDSTSISSGTNGQVSQYSCNAIASGDYSVLSVFVGARAENAVGGPQNVQLGVRSNGADSFSANVSGMGTAYSNFQAQWNTNPNNSNAAWTVADLSSIQVGVKAIA